MSEQQVRAIAICVIEDRGRLLLFEGIDSATGKPYYRPLGGQIEFGELGAECVARELEEEIGAKIEEVAYVGLIENRFTCDGKQGHEIVLVYRARFTDPARYKSGPVVVNEEGQTLIAYWVDLVNVRSGETRLVPEGLLELLER